MDGTCIRLVVVAIFLAVLFSPANCGASTGSGQEQVVLTLSEAVHTALRSNKNLAVRSMDAEAAAATLNAERGGFDPFLEGLAEFGEPFTDPGRESDGAESGPRRLVRRSEIDGRIVKPIPTGGEIFLGSSIEQRKIEGVEQTPLAAGLELGLEQPLLRGLLFGGAKNPQRLALIELETADLQVLQSALDLVRDVEVAYWSLVAGARREVVARSALATAQRLVEETKARDESGLADRIEILEAESARAAREEAVILAKQETSDAHDDLLALLGLLGGAEPLFDRATEPFLSQPDLREEDLVLAEMRLRLPDYQLALQDVARLKVLLNQARGEALPELDLFATGQVEGEDSSYFRFLKEKPSRDTLDWSVGLRVTLPLTFREERARVAAARAQLMAGKLGVEQVDLELRLELRKARRASSSALARIEAAAAARLLAEERFEQLRARFLEGLVPLRDLLPAQDDMEEARGREITARLDAAAAAARLGRIDGSSALRHGLIWQGNRTQTESLKKRR